MEEQISKLGKVGNGFSTFKLKDALVKNDAGDWGSEPDNNAIGVIRSTNFSNDGKLDLSDVAYRTLKPNKRIEKLLYAGDILIERSGGSDSQPVGRVGLITNDIAKTDWAFANFIQRISLDTEIEPTYLFYCLQQMYEMGITASMQYQTTGIRNLDWKLYTKTILPKPPKPEQTAIATILSKVDEAIAATQNSIKAAEKLKKALMQNLFTGKLKPDGSWRSEDEFYEDEKFGKVPKGWEVKKLKDVFFVNQNSLPSQTDGNFTFRYITIEAVQTENIDFESCPEYAFKDSPGRARRIINDNDILISGVRPNLKAFAIYQKPNDENWICSTGFYVLSAKDDESHKYHFYQILSEIGEKQLHSYVAGSNYPAIGDRDLKLLKLLRPPYDEQCLIEEKISSISIENSKKQTKIQTLQRLKKSLMQSLLTGKVRLPQEFIAQFEEVEEINNQKNTIA